MKNKEKLCLSSPAIKILSYGSFAVLCHLAATTLYCTELLKKGLYMFSNIFPLLFQYSAMSFTLVICGTILFDITVKEIDKKNREE